MTSKTDYAKIERNAALLKKTGSGVVYALLTVWAIMVLFPFYWMLLTSIKCLQLRVHPAAVHPCTHAAKLH